MMAFLGGLGFVWSSESESELVPVGPLVAANVCGIHSIPIRWWTSQRVRDHKSNGFRYGVWG